MQATTFLLDLDNTLLGNPMDKFLPVYFALLEKRLAQFTDGRDLRHLMYASVQRMQANQDPTVTNMSAFMQDFTKRLGVSPDAIQPNIDAFYRDDYPRLQRHTSHRPAARAVVEHLLTAGCTVVIATNPLFPATAIQQRLAWANAADFPYARITTMENSHFSKPNPRYYQEILAHVQAQPAQSWMVGDDPIHDIAPAHAMGLKSWWITDAVDSATTPNPLPPCDQSGTLAAFLDWIRLHL